MATGNPLSMQVLDALSRGDKIGAIKLMRQASGPGLKAAMQAVEAQGASVPRAIKQEAAKASQARSMLQERRSPTVAMGDPPGQMRWLLVVAGLLAAAIWLAFGSGF